ncbi:MAG TPA: TetR/AcrR family transcriptional regulator [Gammaproteobacteria bacterium]|nr:TetR/AcrR family transcriptional regulator [Gammaproteobacteria bacterium]
MAVQAQPEDNAATAPGGREAKREAILEGARRVFLDVGFGVASMDAIAVAAKVSKQTVYNHFGSKEELFAAMIRSTCDRMLVAFEEAAKSGKPEETLRAMAHQVIDRVLDRDRLSLYRILIAEGQRFPELGQIFYECGPQVTRKYLADYFAEQNARGTMHVEDPAIAAEQFFGILSGCNFKAQLGIEPAPTRGFIDRYVENAVALMMRAYGGPARR